MVEDNVAWMVGDGQKISLWFDRWVGDNPLALEDDISISDGLEDLKVSDVILNDHSWDFVKLQEICPEKTVNFIRVIPIPWTDGAKDSLHWPTGKGGKFSVSFAFNDIVGREDNHED